MAQNVLIAVLFLIGSECILLVAANEEQQQNANLQLNANVNTENAAVLAAKRRADIEIQTILFGETPKLQECVPTEATFRRKLRIYDNKPVWTVVIIQEETYRNRTLNIQHCSGSLIHPQVVLTAAHCVFKKSLSGLKVRAGVSNNQIDRNSAYHESHIESVKLLAAYDNVKPKGDIALLFLKDPFTISANIKVVCLPPASVPLNLDYVRCFTTSWKRQSLTLPGHRNFKKYNLNIVPNDKCQKVLRFTGLGDEFNLHKSLMCASGEFSKSVLSANGGAPLVCQLCGTTKQMIQVGVMSWGFENTTLPEVFSSVRNARRWMTEQLKEKGLKLSACGIKWRERGVLQNT